MKRFKISKEQAVALAESIIIWYDRKEGIENGEVCPLCNVIYHDDCSKCIIDQDSGNGCGSTEYFKWNAADCRGDLEDMQKYGTLMYNRLVRLQSESETFTIVDK